MSPFSAPVLGGAALLTGPSWWNVVQGTAPVSEAVIRFLICVAVCWVALELLAVLVGPAPRSVGEGADAEESAEAGASAQPTSY